MQQIHGMIEYMLEHLPSRMHLIIATRFDPPLPLPRLRAHGELVEIRADELSFTADETSAFFQKGMDIVLSKEDLDRLEDRTEGWAAGLQLAALSMQGREHVSAFIKSFTGDERHVADYLIEEVLQRQSETVQTFLLQTSILGRLSGPLCDAVTRRSDSHQMLQDLDKANLFINPLDDERRWYRYHHLFAELLHQRLHQVHGNLDPELHRRASEWYERNGLTAVAIYHALSAKDFDRAMDLIEAIAEETIMRSELATLLGWFAALPDDTLCLKPLLCVYQATAMLLSGQSLEESEAHLPDTAASDMPNSVTGAVSLFRSIVTAYQGDRRQSAELAHQALELLPEENLFFRSMAAGIIGLNTFYSGDLKAATQALEYAARISEQAGNLMNAVLAVCHLAELAWLQGQLRQAEALYLRALKLGTDEQGRLRPIAGIALIGQGGLQWERNDLTSASRKVAEGIKLTKKWGETGAITGHLNLARIFQSQGDHKNAQMEIENARQIAIKFDAMEMDDILVDLYQTRLWVILGNLEAAIGWIRERDLDGGIGGADPDGDESQGLSSLLYVLERMTLARVEIARGQPGRALEVLEALLQSTERGGWRAYHIEILVLQSLALQSQGDVHRAAETLTEALVLGEPEGYIRTFIDHGESMGSLLERVLTITHAEKGQDRIQVSRDYLKKLLLALKTRPIIQPDGSLVEHLSERELEVLRLIATGLSNSKIAQNLFISLNTVKTHIKNIHSKLHVHTRTQAVARANELGLL